MCKWQVYQKAIKRQRFNVFMPCDCPESGQNTQQTSEKQRDLSALRSKSHSDGLFLLFILFILFYFITAEKGRSSEG
jgi:hypothetical protein